MVTGLCWGRKLLAVVGCWFLPLDAPVTRETRAIRVIPARRVILALTPQCLVRRAFRVYRANVDQRAIPVQIRLFRGRRVIVVISALRVTRVIQELIPSSLALRVTREIRGSVDFRVRLPRFLARRATKAILVE
ncbi:UNVERIFIED_ORG: hypothetical protein M2328_005811 [Rhodococcus erythropolis]